MRRQIHRVPGSAGRSGPRSISKGPEESVTVLEAGSSYHSPCTDLLFCARSTLAWDARLAILTSSDFTIISQTVGAPGSALVGDSGA